MAFIEPMHRNKPNITYSWKTRICLYFEVSTMFVDNLVTQGLRAAAAMVLTQVSWNILVSAASIMESFLFMYSQFCALISYFDSIE